jgi:hypothetical protein
MPFAILTVARAFSSLPRAHHVVGDLSRVRYRLVAAEVGPDRHVDHVRLVRPVRRLAVVGPTPAQHGAAVTFVVRGWIRGEEREGGRVAQT